MQPFATEQNNFCFHSIIHRIVAHPQVLTAMLAPLDRFSAIPGLLIASSICYTLLGLHLHGYRSSEGAVNWTKEHRTLVTVLVQLISQMLGLIHVHAICECGLF